MKKQIILDYIEKHERVFTVITNCFWFLTILVLTFCTPLESDDINHSYVFGTAEKFSRVSDLFRSISNYYMIWGGRAVSMVCIQLSILFPKFIFNMLNALVFIVIGNIILCYSKIGDEQKRSLNTLITLNIIFLCMWFLAPDFHETTLWLTGSITYMWENCIVLLFGYYYYKKYILISNSQKTEHANITITCVGMTILGFLAGFSAEASSCALMFGLLVYAIWAYKTHNNPNVIDWCGAIGAILGWACLIFAPGNFARSEYVSNQFESSNIIFNYMWRIVRETYYGARFLFVPLAIAVVIGVIARHNNNSKNKDVILYIISFISIYVMTFSNAFAWRIFQFPFFILTIIIARNSMTLLNKIKNEDHNIIKKAVFSGMSILYLLAIIEITFGAVTYKVTGQPFDRQTIYYAIGEQGIFPGNGASE